MGNLGPLVSHHSSGGNVPTVCPAVVGRKDVAGEETALFLEGAAAPCSQMKNGRADHCNSLRALFVSSTLLSRITSTNHPFLSSTHYEKH